MRFLAALGMTFGFLLIGICYFMVINWIYGKIEKAHDADTASRVIIVISLMLIIFGFFSMFYMMGV